MRAEASNDVAALIARLDERARVELAARREQTTREIARMEREAAETRGARRDRALRECSDSVTVGASSAIAAAMLDARREVLEAQHALVDDVLRRVLSRVPSLVSEARLGSEQLVRRIDRLMTYLDTPPAELRCRAELVPRVRDLVAADWPRTRVVADDAATGLRALDENGRLTVDDTLETRLVRMRRELTIEICRAADPQEHVEAQGL